MYLQQFFVKGLGHASYLVGDESAGVAFVVDPRRDVADYVAAAGDEGLRITDVLETHVHNDYVSGADELRRLTGATVHVSPDAGLTRPHEPMRDGDELRVGSLRVRAVATPGHTPDHLSFLVADLSRTDEDWILLSGGALLVGTAARPDLLGGPEEARRAAGVLFDTLTERIAPLPDWMELYPTHGAGSLCGSGIGGKRWSTVGFERRHNPALSQPDADAFADYILADQPSVPAYWRRMRPTNQAGALPMAELGAPRALTADELSHAAGHGAVIIDARDPELYAAGHIPGALSVGLSDTFGTWAGSMVPIDREIVLVLERLDDLEPAVAQLRRAGFDRVVGYLNGGVDAWSGETETLRRVPARAVPEERATVLDVRELSEWREGRIPDAVHIPGAQLPTRLDEVPEGPILVVCGGGYRSAIAASLLAREGREEVAHVSGGMDAYRSAGLPLEMDEPARKPVEVG
ncbi:MAG TPA: MBL fold metallo-hydrolase [Candidatus Limnocylindria bacterium]|nr:MBL fold metallo-hydrolase [Candidatus Limnocylindria bacterium]